MNALRPIFVLIAAVWFLQLAGGTLSVIVPLGLSELGASPTQIGVIAALYAAGMMMGAWLAPQLVARIGNILRGSRRFHGDPAGLCDVQQRVFV